MLHMQNTYDTVKEAPFIQYLKAQFHKKIIKTIPQVHQDPLYQFHPSPSCQHTYAHLHRYPIYDRQKLFAVINYKINADTWSL
jgi:hypothetical protein